jgi:hypothetical protein
MNFNASADIAGKIYSVAGRLASPGEKNEVDIRIIEQEIRSSGHIDLVGGMWGLASGKIQLGPGKIIIYIIINDRQ